MAKEIVGRSFEVKGIKELTDKLNKLPPRVGVNIMRRVQRKVLYPVRDQMKTKAPRGNKWHKVYTGRHVNGGFLKQSIKAQVSLDKRRGSVIGKLGVLREAFYGINFLDQGPHTVRQRRTTQKHKKRTGFKIVGILRPYRASAYDIKPYTIRQRPWFERTFLANGRRMIDGVRRELGREVEKAFK